MLKQSRQCLHAGEWYSNKRNHVKIQHLSSMWS